MKIDYRKEIDQDYWNEFNTLDLICTLEDENRKQIIKEIKEGKIQIRPLKKYLEKYKYIKEEELTQEVKKKIEKLDEIVKKINEEINKIKEGEFNLQQISEYCKEAKKLIYGDETFK